MAGSSVASKLLNPVNPALRNLIQQSLIRPSATAAAHFYQPTQESPKSPSIQSNDFIGDPIRRSISSAINVNLGSIPSGMPMGFQRSYYPNAGKVVLSRSDSEFEESGVDDDEVGDFGDSDFDDENDEDEDGSWEDEDDVNEFEEDPSKEVANESKKSPSGSRKC